MSIVGKYLLTHWVNGGYEDKWLRFINRETSKHYISDVGYSLNVGTGYTYSIMKNCAAKFAKNPDGTFRRSEGIRSNTDGDMTFKLMEKPSDVYCKHSFDEIFNVDLREVLKEDSSTLDYMSSFAEICKIPKKNLNRLYKLSNNLTTITELGEWEQHLVDLFGVKEFYRVRNYVEENSRDMSFIQKDVTYMHVNMLSDYRQGIPMKEAHKMQTIGFWLFEDKLIYFYASGKSTW